MLYDVTELLVCPACHAALIWQIVAQHHDRILAGEAICSACQTHYPIIDEIGLFLLPDWPRKDLWEESESQLEKYLTAHPDIKWQLLHAPLQELSPTDQQLRALLLEAQGAYLRARTTARVADQGLYLESYREGRDAQMAYLLERLAAAQYPIVDLASGRLNLVERIVDSLHCPIIVTDFSPRVLRRNREWLRFFKRYEYVSLVACDTRRTPFRTDALPTVTTYLGLANITHPSDLATELRRIVHGAFWSIHHFFAAEDAAHRQAITELGLETFLYRDSAIASLEQAGFTVHIPQESQQPAAPTPPSHLLADVRLDSLPIAETTLTWSVIQAT